MRLPTRIVTILFGFALILTFSCKSPPDNITPRYIAEQFYNGYNNSDFEQVNKYANDSIKIIWKGNVVCRSLNELYQGFQYDSVFSPEIKILEIKSNDKILEVTLSKFDKRIKYLHDTAFV